MLSQSLFYNKGVALVKTTPCGKCDPVGMQTQDLQNFFSTRSFCSLNTKGEPTSDSPYYYVIPLGFKPKTFRTFSQPAYSALKIKKV